MLQPAVVSGLGSGAAPSESGPQNGTEGFRRWTHHQHIGRRMRDGRCFAVAAVRRMQSAQLKKKLNANALHGATETFQGTAS